MKVSNCWLRYIEWKPCHLTNFLKSLSEGWEEVENDRHRKPM